MTTCGLQEELPRSTRGAGTSDAAARVKCQAVAAIRASFACQTKQLGHERPFQISSAHGSKYSLRVMRVFR